jgi:hypothetical protein
LRVYFAFSHGLSSKRYTRGWLHTLDMTYLV